MRVWSISWPFKEWCGKIIWTTKKGSGQLPSIKEKRGQRWKLQVSNLAPHISYTQASVLYLGIFFYYKMLELIIMCYKIEFFASCTGTWASSLLTSQKTGPKQVLRSKEILSKIILNIDISFLFLYLLLFLRRLAKLSSWVEPSGSRTSAWVRRTTKCPTSSGSKSTGATRKPESYSRLSKCSRLVLKGWVTFNATLPAVTQLLLNFRLVSLAPSQICHPSPRPKRRRLTLDPCFQCRRESGPHWPNTGKPNCKGIYRRKHFTIL